jgi:hypothetical protein
MSAPKPFTATELASLRQYADPSVIDQLAEQGPGLLRRAIELQSRVAELDARAVRDLGLQPIPGVVAFLRENWFNDGAEGEAVHKLCAYAEAVPKLLARIAELEDEDDALTARLACPDCHDGGACLPGGCGVEGCERCGKPCSTCNGSCDVEPAKLVARVKELEAEVVRVRDLINVDRTGLAATLNHVRAIVSGYDWIPAGEWGSYPYNERHTTTLRDEVGNLLASVRSAIERGLRESGNRADSAHRNGPTVPLAPARSELEQRIAELETQLAAAKLDLDRWYTSVEADRLATILQQRDDARAEVKRLERLLAEREGLLRDILPVAQRDLLRAITGGPGTQRDASPQTANVLSLYERCRRAEEALEKHVRELRYHDAAGRRETQALLKAIDEAREGKT